MQKPLTTTRNITVELRDIPNLDEACRKAIEQAQTAVSELEETDPEMDYTHFIESIVFTSMNIQVPKYKYNDTYTSFFYHFIVTLKSS